MLSKILNGALLLALVAPAFGADPGASLLGISQAARATNYQGTIVYQSDESLETMRITHGFAGGVERERVQSLNGEPREILKEDGKVTCLLPKDQKLTMQRPTPKGIFLGLTPERVKQIATVYRFQDLGMQRIAGRACHGIAITPRDDLRYGYQVWADEKTQVPLKVNLVSADGVVLEQMMFTEVEFPASIPTTAFQTALAGPQYREVTRFESPPAAATVDAGPQFQNLPPGFRVAMRDVRQQAGGAVEHVLLTDGLTAVSVFTARRDPQARPFIGRSQMGPVNAYGRLMGSVHITVVGEAPQQTVELIGDNLRAVEEPGEGAQPAAVRKP